MMSEIKKVRTVVNIKCDDKNYRTQKECDVTVAIAIGINSSNIDW